MKISDMPEFQDKSEILTFSETTSLSEAIAGMADKNYGAALVTKKDKLAGIFTERDVLRKVAGRGLDTKKEKVKDYMTKDVKTANKDDKITDCLRRMSQGRFRHLPVVGEKDELLGLLSQGDFVAFTMSDVISRFTATSKAEISAGRSTPFSIAAAILLYTIVLIIIVQLAI